MASYSRKKRREIIFSINIKNVHLFYTILNSERINKRIVLFQFIPRTIKYPSTLKY